MRLNITYQPKWCTYSAVWPLHGWCHVKLLPCPRRLADSEFQTDGTKKPNERSQKDFKLRFEIFKGFSLEARRVRDVRYVLSERVRTGGRRYEGGMGWVEQRFNLDVNSRFLVR